MKEFSPRTPASIFPTPLGWMGLLATAQGIRRVVSPRSRRAEVESLLGQWVVRPGLPPSPRARNNLMQARAQLTAYCEGRHKSFRLRLDLDQGSVFQRQVWCETLAIPFGQSWTYQKIAKRLGSPHLARAVGGALGANPLPVLIPCHRVLASGGFLGGYSGGILFKRRLLHLEGVTVPGARGVCHAG